MDIQRLKEIADKIEPREPTHLDIGGHKVCACVRDVKAQLRDVIGILIEDAEEKGKKEKAKAFKC